MSQEKVLSATWLQKNKTEWAMKTGARKCYTSKKKKMSSNSLVD